MSKKEEVLTEIFKICNKKNNNIFNNNLVKKISKKYGFGNPFDATKLDNTLKFPKIMKDHDYFILHLGKGRHQFVENIRNGFHNFELIPDEKKYDWRYRKSILNEFDSSESNILSIGFNQRIVHDFLYNDIVANPKVYNARRTKKSLIYFVGDTKIETKSLQMEIDLTTEYNGVITVFEAKNDFPPDFAIYQIYHPFLYYYHLKNSEKLDILEINCCYLLRKVEDKNSIIRLYNYTFDKPLDMISIKLLKCAQYNLIKR